MKKEKSFIYISKALVINEKGELLLGKTPQAKWELIGGKSEPDELDTRQTLTREFSEEVAGALIHPTHLWRRSLREGIFIDYYVATLCWANAEHRLIPLNGELVDIKFMSKRRVESLQPTKFLHDHHAVALQYLLSLKDNLTTS